MTRLTIIIRSNFNPLWSYLPDLVSLFVRPILGRQAEVKINDYHMALFCSRIAMMRGERREEGMVWRGCVSLCKCQFSAMRTVDFSQTLSWKRPILWNVILVFMWLLFANNEISSVSKFPCESISNRKPHDIPTNFRQWRFSPIFPFSVSRCHSFRNVGALTAGALHSTRKCLKKFELNIFSRKIRGKLFRLSRPQCE